MKIPEPNYSIQSKIDKHHDSLAASCACCAYAIIDLANSKRGKQ